MKEIKIEKCPYCGGTEFVDAMAGSYGGVYAGVGCHTSAIRVVVCRDCGSIVRAYVKDAEKLYPKKQRRQENETFYK